MLIAIMIGQSAFYLVLWGFFALKNFMKNLARSVHRSVLLPFFFFSSIADKSK